MVGVEKPIDDACFIVLVFEEFFEGHANEPENSVGASILKDFSCIFDEVACRLFEPILDGLVDCCEIVRNITDSSDVVGESGGDCHDDSLRALFQDGGNMRGLKAEHVVLETLFGWCFGLDSGGVT